MRRRIPRKAAVISLAVGAVVAGLAAFAINSTPAFSDIAQNEQCRPDGLYRTPSVDVPYCLAYDTAGREKMGADHPRRVIGYFTSWRTGKDGTPAYLASNIPWTKVTHINYAFAHVDAQNRISVGNPTATNNSATNMTWPGVAGAEMDPAFSYTGHFNLLNKFKKANPNVKTLVSVGGWAETGGYFDETGARQDSGGFYRMTTTSVEYGQYRRHQHIRRLGRVVPAHVRLQRRRHRLRVPDLEHEGRQPAGLRPGRRQTGRAQRVLCGADEDAAGEAGRGSRCRRQVLHADRGGARIRLAAARHGVVPGRCSTSTTSTSCRTTCTGRGTSTSARTRRCSTTATTVSSPPPACTAPTAASATSTPTGPTTTSAERCSRAGSTSACPYYTRGWQNVTGGTNGLWGTAPKTADCPPGTQSPCGNGAIGIDNLWHDTRPPQGPRNRPARTRCGTRRTCRTAGRAPTSPHTASPRRPTRRTPLPAPTPATTRPRSSRRGCGTTRRRSSCPLRTTSRSAPRPTTWSTRASAAS